MICKMSWEGGVRFEINPICKSPVKKWWGGGSDLQLTLWKKVYGVRYAINPCFVSKTYKICCYQLINSCGYWTGHSGGNLIKRAWLLNPNFVSCTDLCSSLIRMGWWQTFRRFPTWTLRCQMMWLIAFMTNFKSSHILQKILLWVNIIPRGISGMNCVSTARRIPRQILH